MFLCEFYAKRLALTLVSKYCKMYNMEVFSDGQYTFYMQGLTGRLQFYSFIDMSGSVYSALIGGAAVTMSTKNLNTPLLNQIRTCVIPALPPTCPLTASAAQTVLDSLDFNECEDDANHNCSGLSTCINSPPGNYSCICHQGYTGLQCETGILYVYPRDWYLDSI